MRMRFTIDELSRIGNKAAVQFSSRAITKSQNLGSLYCFGWVLQIRHAYFDKEGIVFGGTEAKGCDERAATRQEFLRLGTFFYILICPAKRVRDSTR